MGEKIRLDVLLTQRGIVTSRSRAQEAIRAGKISVNGEVQQRPGFLLQSNADIRVVEPLMPYVSRAALKLEHALDVFAVSVAGRVALDVGASTGGFTQVLLARNANLVFAVDVGTNQLHPTLQGDERIVSLEGVNIRSLEPGSLIPQPSLVVIDVSFISLQLVLPAVIRHVAGEGDIIALVKPQFEVGRRYISKGGIVRDSTRRKQAVHDVMSAAQSAGYELVAKCDSPIQGSDGNHEYLLHLRTRS